MPNTRRRRFSVQNELNARSWPKFQNNLGLSYLENSQDIKIRTLDRNKIPQPPKKIVLECAISATNLKSLRKRSTNTMDKNVTASSSNIDLFNILTIAEASKIFPKEPVFSSNVPLEPEPKHLRPEHRQSSRKRTHRVKVRSPKRKIVSPIIEKPPIICERVNTGTNAIVWEQEIEIRTVDMETSFTEPPEEIDRQSSHSIEDMCRICHGGASLNGELGMLVSACACRGTIGRVHVKCLERWLTESGKSRCELCGTRYATRRVHRYGVPRALIMWILSQNAKQLMVDSLGIMLMSPLAVLAAWLSGRTLAGLMTQEPHVTPWPLASTFVLACMTLVCYYCWIVSAATRHALGWWVWYRSQYEVRLQQLENED